MFFSLTKIRLNKNPAQWLWFVFDCCWS